jgi:hypothetical protein
MYRTIHLIVLFYGPVFVFNCILSFVGAVAAFSGGGISYAVAIYLLCFFTGGLLFGLWCNHRFFPMEYMYYTNAGVPVRKLLGGSAILNTGAGILFCVVTHMIITGGLG